MERSKNKQSKPELSRKQKLARRLLPALALSLAAGGYAGAKLQEKAEYHEIGTERVMIDDGNSPIGAVATGVKDIAEQRGFNLNEVPGIVSEGQEVAREVRARDDLTIVPAGTEIEVTVSKNGFGNYKVEADPADR